MRFVLPVLVLLLSTGCAAALPGAAQSGVARPLQTYAERSGWTSLTPHTEVVSFYETLAASSPDVRLEEIGRSREGRPLQLLTLARPSLTEPWQAHASGKPIVLIVAQVHGDEPAGKEGLMLFARDLVAGPLSSLLDRVVFLFVPQLNPDGAEAGTWGTRANAAGFNLNRDYLRLSNPETRALVEEVIVRWRPHVVVDAHELSGPPRIYDFYTWYPDNFPGPDAPARLAGERLVPVIVAALENAGFSHILYHTPGRLAEDPASGLQVPIDGSTLNDYAASHGAVSVLFESLRDRDARVGIERRARSQRIAMEALARFVVENPSAVLNAVAEGHREMQQRGASWSSADSIPIRYDVVTRREIDYRVGEMRRVQTEQGATWEPTGRILEVQAPVIDSVVVTMRRVRPVGYLLEPHRRDLAEHLAAHGLQVERLLAPAEVRVESFRVDSIRPAGAPYEGFFPQSVWATTELRTASFPAGAYLIRADQPAAALAFQLLEPEDENSYASSGRLMTQAGRGRLLPVHRVVALPSVPRALLR